MFVEVYQLLVRKDRLLFFKKMEEVKRFDSVVWSRNTGFDCIDAFDSTRVECGTSAIAL